MSSNNSPPPIYASAALSFLLIGALALRGYNPPPIPVPTKDKVDEIKKWNDELKIKAQANSIPNPNPNPKLTLTNTNPNPN
jgi:hypothetical protein